jgi:hypothetical protein
LPEKKQHPITRENLNVYLKDLAKEFRKLNGTKTPAEIILIGGAAVLAGYGFREHTFDIDAIIVASSVMKEAILRISDKYGLPSDWLNADFKRTTSYSDKLYQFSKYYRTYSNIVEIRVITAEYLLAMKLMSGRQYKNDLSDIVGVLWEHQKSGTPILRKAIEKAVASLYGDETVIPETSIQMLNIAFSTDDYESLYHQTRDSEIDAKDILLEFERDYPNTMKSENINDIINKGRNRVREERKEYMITLLEEKKRELAKQGPAS